MANKPKKKKVATNPSDNTNATSGSTKRVGKVKFCSKVFVYIAYGDQTYRIVRPAGDIKVGDEIEF